MRKRKGNGIKIFIGILVPVVLFTMFLAVVCNDTTIKVGLGNCDGQYATVLANIDGIVEANPRYVDIAMLGSHDAVTSTLTDETPLDYHDKDSILGKVDPISSGIQYRFGKTQAVGLGQQLLQGARFFHIKCTDYEGEWYGTHAHLTGKLSDHILELLKYLASDAAKGEIVGLLFQTMYMGDGVTLDTLHEDLNNVKYNGKSIFDYVYIEKADTFDNGNGGVRIGELTYNDLTKNGTAPGVVIFDRREEKVFKAEWEGSSALTARCYDMDSCADHEWHSSIGEEKLISKINATCDRIAGDEKYQSKLRMNQTQASFAVGSAKEFFEIIGSWSLLRFAKDYNVTLINHENFDKWLTYMPVFQVDFCNSNHGDFNNKVNKLIIEHNQATVNRLLSE